MERNFKYDCITLNDIDSNDNFIFICDGDNKKVILEKGDENNE